MTFSKLNFNKLTETALERAAVSSKPELEKYFTQKKTEPKRRAGWVRLARQWWFDALKGLSPTQRIVLTELLVWAQNKGYCWPSGKTMANHLGVSLKTIWRSIEILEKKGFIKIEKKEGKSNTYYLIFR
ncbi:MAG: helix-turn-helix domain-containing protein [bacterium]|nr:helix-turn-helix domain-containing protein [bacterium]